MLRFWPLCPEPHTAHTTSKLRWFFHRAATVKTHDFYDKYIITYRNSRYIDYLAITATKIVLCDCAGDQQADRLFIWKGAFPYTDLYFNFYYYFYFDHSIRSGKTFKPGESR